MRWERYSPNSINNGFTIIELLVAAALGVLVLGMAAGLVIVNRRVYDLDRARTALNQNLRSALDIIGADVRQAGEGVGADLPAIEIVDGGDADELVLRKNLLGVVLPVCMSVVGNTNDVFINSQGASGHGGPACATIDGNGNGWDDRQEAWRDYRCAQDGVAGCQGNNDEQVRAYVYNPANGEGEWFSYVGEDMSHFKIHKSAQPAWQHSYPVSDHPRLYLLEEHLYRLGSDGLIELINNGDSANAQGLIDRAIKFRVRARLSDGSWKDAMGAGDDWTKIAAIDVAITGRYILRRKTIERTLKSEFMPRNVLSH